jgi:hypothetical protein
MSCLNLHLLQITLQPKQLNVALRVHNTGASGMFQRVQAPT